MRIKSVILGLILVIVGIVLFSIAAAGQKKERQLLQEQQKKTEDNINALEKLVAGEINVDSFAQSVPSDDWESSFSTPPANKENTELKLITSTVCMGIGTTLLIWWPLLWIIRRTTKALSKLRKNDLFTIEGAKQIKNPSSREEKISKQTKQKDSTSSADKSNADQTVKTTAKLAVSLSDEKAGSTQQTLKTSTTTAVLNEAQPDGLARNIRKTISAKLTKTSSMSADLAKKQPEHKSQQANTHKNKSHCDPLNSTLMELTEQVAAIREYASQQQDRVEKLQGGYDWNITKNFCLRVIRCVDNLEKRINRLRKQNINPTVLQEVHDELLFVLESSGVEQFRPEINSDYRGQERFAEVTKDRQPSEDKNMTDKIAKVIRPGYRYVIDEENVKVVRTAQVKLFTCAQSDKQGA
ncbi:MAG: nucleotide exchange factor GrpE [Planctomycetota bacterium]|jgi:molecular chaperone GrpE (heat shock protein)